MPNEKPEMILVNGAREPERDGGPREAAHYIKGRIEELATLARAHRLDMLGYLLDMAHREADEAVRRDSKGPS